MWLQHVKWLYMLGQIVKLSSVFCLIVASFERYLVTSHWTFGGFEERTRWLLLILVLTLAIAIRFSTSVEVIVLFDSRNVDPFKRYTAGQVSRRDWLPNFLSLLTVIIPFGTLVFFNGGIVLMLRQQNVQQLRSLITELTMGHDFMKVRRRNIRAATNTLLFIISAYLISNLLNLFLSFLVFLQPDFASVLTVIGNALRFPAHFFSNGEVREQLLSIFYTSEKISSSNASVLPTKQPLSTVLQLRRHSERLENPWFSALLTARPSETSPEIFKKLSNSNSSKSNSRKSTQQQLHKISNTSSNFNGKGAAQLRSYIHGALEASQKVEGIKRLPAPQFGGICAICNEYFINSGDCCSGGNLETEREPLFEELFKYEQRINEKRPLIKENDDKKEEEEEREEEDSTKSTTQPRPTPEDEDEDVDFSKLKFDPADFASLAMAI
uniref:G_PROTEIN_RECEP_F1_2 domain-containing protein n=1 Tax=Meloidogyne hapla TaxID=6305 RepID=A0A1I8AYQ2_MELHA